MSRIYLGKYVNTHGIKGEIRILSDFKYKDRVFQINKEIIINDIKYKILSHRVHKGYDMVTLENILSINEIPFPKNSKVFIEREDYLGNDDYLDSDLIGFLAYNSKLNQVVTDIMYLNNQKKLLKCHDKLIPFELIENVNLESRKILIKEVDGL